MAIGDNQVKAVKYPPEKLPDSWFGAVPGLAEVVPAVLDLRRFQPYIATLTDIQLTANANVELRARCDDIRVNENTAAMLSALVQAWQFPAKSLLNLNFYGLAPVANYTCHYGLWVQKPTVADKLLHGIKLTPEESAIADKLGVRNTVDKGLLPLPIQEQIEREYRVMDEETHSRSVNINLAAPAVFTIESIYARPDEIIVLTRIAANPGPLPLGANNIIISITRDGDLGVGNVRTWPLSLLAGGEISCFVPAVREIMLTATAVVPPAAHLFRYTFQRIRLSNILRMRFGLLTKEDNPDLWERVVAGIV